MGFSLATLGSDDISSLTLEQKKAIVLFLYSIMVSTFPKEKRQQKKIFIENYAKELDIDLLECIDYLDIVGVGFLKILRELPDLQKEFLFILAFEYANCDGAPSENEFSIIAKYLRRVHFSETILLQTIYKHDLINSLKI